MAKITQSNFNETVNTALRFAQEKNIIHLTAQKTFHLSNQHLINSTLLHNFGTCGYLGLEKHPEILKSIRESLLENGAQFSISRCYLDSQPNVELENQLSTIFNQQPVITYTSTTLAHLSLIPIIVSSNDLVIVDQQAHISMQQCLQIASAKGAKVELIRHNNIEMLRQKITNQKDKYEKIWIVVDGVYSMFGDLAPIKEINEMMQEFPKLHLYMDDAHGMSWYGNFGSGRLFQDAYSNKRTVYVTTLAKGFGTMGGIVVFPNEELYWKVKLHGGPLAYSHPIPPPMLAASLASCRIHLSSEIASLQEKLKNNIDYLNQLIHKSKIILESNPETPINFLGIGKPEMGFELNSRLFQEGYYVNIAMFPAVPVNNTGIRFTLTTNQSLEQIKGLVDAISYHFPIVQDDYSFGQKEILHAFRKNKSNAKKQLDLKIEYSNTIGNINKSEWDSIFAQRGNFSWEALQIIEKGFQNNPLPEENWKMHYLIIRETEANRIILATFLTSGIFKDDIFSDPRISREIERLRTTDNYYLTSKMLIQGAMITEGDHLYFDENSASNFQALEMFLQELTRIQLEEKINGIYLRDYRYENTALSNFFKLNGFISVILPNANHISFENCENHNLYNLLSKESKRHIRKDVLNHKEQFVLECKSELNTSELNLFYNLYIDLAKKSFDINIFHFPKKFFEKANESEAFEFYILKRSETLDIVSIVLAYKNTTLYCPLVIGYCRNESKVSVYKQTLYQLVNSVKERNYKNIYLGFSADIEKRKLGAKQISKYGFIKLTDTYNHEVIQNMTI